MSAPDGEARQAPLLPFTKMSGGGNDFVVVDAGELTAIGDPRDWVRRVCRRGLSVGADGVLIVGPSESAHVRLIHYNADGGRSSLCGNGTRCAARWARMRGRGEDPLRVETDAGVMEARFPGGASVALSLGLRCAPPEPMAIHLADGTGIRGHFVEVGIPHFIQRVDAIDEVPVERLGSRIRSHPAFGEPGTNVSFVAPRADGSLDIRTFERGVEEETLACGTGCVAAAVVAVAEEWCSPPVRCHTRSGIDLVVHVTLRDGGYEDLVLQGDARVVYEGRLTTEGSAWGGPAGPE